MPIQEQTPQRIEITLNGALTEIPAGLHVAALLDHVGAPARAVAVERNRTVVRRSDHAKTRVEAGDVIEIVSFVGGG